MAVKYVVERGEKSWGWTRFDGGVEGSSRSGYKSRETATKAVQEQHDRKADGPFYLTVNGEGDFDALTVDDEPSRDGDDVSNAEQVGVVSDTPNVP